MSYQEKYMKYKNKYTLLKESIFKGYSIERDSKESLTPNKNKFFNLRKQIEEFNIINEDRKIARYNLIYNKPLKYLMYGGELASKIKTPIPTYELQSDERIQYLKRCEQMYCDSTEIVNYKKIIAMNIDSLYQVTAKVVEYYKTKLPLVYAKMKGKLANIILKDISYVTLPMLNIISLQCVILFTELVKITNPIESTMFSPDDFIKKLYNDLTKDDNWEIYEVIEEKVKQNNYLKNLVTEVCCPNLKKARILVILGELSIEEILKSLSDEIYFIGIVTKLTWADGAKLTPFEFMMHDLSHATIRSHNTYNNIYEKQFIFHIIKNKDIYGKKMDQMCIILFLIMHETPFTITDKKILNDNIPESSMKFTDYILSEEVNWKNKYFYGGLLPKEIFENPDFNTTVKYIKDSFEILKIEWEKFFSII